jgi:hypothetical protein
MGTKSYIVSKDLESQIRSMKKKLSGIVDDTDLMDSIRFLKKLHRDKYGKPNEFVHGVQNAIHEEPSAIQARVPDGEEAR